MSAGLDRARALLEDAIAAFRRAAQRAVDTAADPKAPQTAVVESRHAATFGLAAVGAALKGALKAARPSEDP